MTAYHPPGDPIALEVRLTTAPDGRPAIVLQLPQGHVLFPHPEQVEALAMVLMQGAIDLRAVITDPFRSTPESTPN